MSKQHGITNRVRLVGFMCLVFTALMIGQNIVPPPTVRWIPTWKTVKLGTLKNVGTICKALIGRGYEVDSWAYDILGSPAFQVSQKETQLDLVLVSGRDFGLKNRVTCKEIYKQALMRGLALCPSEVGPQLRLQYADQPLGESINVAMEPIADSDSGLSVFVVWARRMDGRRLLDAGGSDSDCVWYADNYWVFVRRHA